MKFETTVNRSKQIIILKNMLYTLNLWLNLVLVLSLKTKGITINFNNDKTIVNLPNETRIITVAYLERLYAIDIKERSIKKRYRQRKEYVYMNLNNQQDNA